MKKILNLLLVGLMIPFIVSCSSDDDENVDINNYIVGAWHSYKATVYYEGKSASVDITKSGQYSDMYIEISFNQDGTMVESAWQKNDSGLKNWVQEDARYTIKDDIVSIKDSGGVVDLLFDSKTKELCLQSSTTYVGSTMRTNIYFKK